ncbi:hypothetical protein [Acinetobacter haemolyticus]|uniref:hypothetical protein n=1 Tax=Acinetobacter haemolyticus TaxID=29430 RepID=UPI0013732918|nr:hypothetical protein [Acinetobacter haemolyticus]NAS08133.1 hypothetical protein [Acinetobacter haemolyticus]
MKKFDWFLLGYTFKTTTGHGTGSLVKGFVIESRNKNITNADLGKLTEMAKEGSGVKEPLIDFYITSVCHLGHMTEEEFFEEQSL